VHFSRTGIFHSESAIATRKSALLFPGGGKEGERKRRKLDAVIRGVPGEEEGLIARRNKENKLDNNVSHETSESSERLPAARKVAATRKKPRTQLHFGLIKRRFKVVIAVLIPLPRTALAKARLRGFTWHLAVRVVKQISSKRPPIVSLAFALPSSAARY